MSGELREPVFPGGLLSFEANLMVDGKELLLGEEVVDDDAEKSL
jgi:hypothetical protein